MGGWKNVYNWNVPQAKCKSFPFTSCFKTGSLENEIEGALLTAELKELAPGVSLLPPLTRRGYGPGPIIMLPNGAPGHRHTKKAEHYAKMKSLHQFEMVGGRLCGCTDTWECFWTGRYSRGAVKFGDLGAIALSAMKNTESARKVNSTIGL